MNWRVRFDGMGRRVDQMVYQDRVVIETVYFDERQVDGTFRLVVNGVRPDGSRFRPASHLKRWAVRHAARGIAHGC